MTHSTAREIRQQMAGDPLRPRYHFLPPANWMNDPNGVIQWDGAYHLFYQHNPAAPVHHRIHWGHAVSQDLLHWDDLPLALVPTPGGPDETGVFSGCAVDHDGVPTLVYTGVRGAAFEVQTQCLATSRDGLITWEKHPHNPVLPDVPAIANQDGDFRDPFVWREGDMWLMAVGSRIDGVGGTVFLYRSADLLRWEYVCPLYTGDQARNGYMWECPNFFRLGDRWVLIVSPQYLLPQSGDRMMGSTVYFVGDFDGERFEPFYEGTLDYGCLYAPLSLADDGGRRLTWGWLREERSRDAQMAAGWSGVQLFPRVLSLRNDRLHMQPAPELETIRGAHQRRAALELTPDPVQLDGAGLYFDLELTFDGARLELALACTPDGGQQTRLVYDRAAQTLTLDRARSSTHPDTDRDPAFVPHTLAAGEALTLRVLLDGSVLEIIANGRTSLTSRIYPSQTANLGLRVSGQGTVITLNVWEILSIWR